MKKFTFIFFSFVALLSNAQWTPVISGTFSNLNDIKFVNDSTGFISGSCSAVLLKTTDYGLSWHQITSAPSAAALHDMFWLNEQVGFVCADNTLQKTTDGGVTWSLVNDFTNETPGGVYFTSSSVGYVISSIYGPPGGSFIYKTTDGGNTWTKTNSYQNIPTLQDIDFIGADTGYVVGYFGSVIHTYDGGISWNISNTPTYETIFAASFLNSTKGFVAGYSSGTGVEVAGSVNAGQNWLNFQTGGTMNYALRGLHFISSTSGYACGDNGRLISTADGGNTWAIENSGVTAQLSAVLFIPANIGFTVGSGGVILRTQLPVSISEGQFVSEANNLYPNPAQHTITLDMEEEVQFSLFDSQGKMLMSNKCAGKTIFDVSVFPRGLYIVKIQSEKGSATSKLVVD